MTSSSSRDPHDGNAPRNADPERVGDGMLDLSGDSPDATPRSVTSLGEVGRIETDSPFQGNEHGDVHEEEQGKASLATPLMRGDLMEQQDHPTGVEELDEQTGIGTGISDDEFGDDPDIDAGDGNT